MDEQRHKEARLMHRIANQQTEALDELYDLYGRYVYSVAFHILQSAHQAEEVTIDTFHVVWQNGTSYNPNKGAIATWIGRIARNKALDRIRKENVRVDQTAVPLEANLETAVGQPTPETATSLKLRQERIQQALAQLPPEQRQVIAMAYFYDYTQSQIAQTLDLPLGTVKTRIRLGMNKLQLLLIGEDEKIGLD